MADVMSLSIDIPPPQPGRAIALYARETPGHAARVAATLQRLRDAAATHPGRIVQATSLGAEDMVLTDLIVRHRLPIAIATLDTGRLHAETLALIERVQAHYGVAVEVWQPDAAAVEAFVREHGPDAMYRSRDLRHACCALRKLAPLQRLLVGRSAWITGLRREQSAHRAEVPWQEADAQGRTKFNPLADWSWADVWHYIARHGVPYHPLHDAFMPSIGCAPCTRPIAVGEDFRAGRWWWEQDDTRECGLHLPTRATPNPLATEEGTA
ncbi:Thioredoxin-dependent 5'-adenylylsulfate reductase [Tepidimonas thermarum]|uniref:Adenosine 5'-phosphosulfate reductase n=1 Tax=Tepidimonas thermarum TaxID=335431 RepID=A0A554X2R2_9BURK|nr:Thioredoxin-dependent 5'-adenylylsulfate reductase [Tepidimonas thermarum]